MKGNPFPTHLMNRLSGILFPLLLLYVLTACTPVVSEDYIVYTVGDYSDSGFESHLMRYDPGTDTHTALVPGWQIETINLSADNRLAFSSSQEGKSHIYILDYPFASSTLRDITPNSDAEKRLYGWSKEGRYLLYEAAQMDRKTLFVWDGESSRAIYDINSIIGSLDWSADGRLAFTELHYVVRGTDQETQDDSEVFMWDGADVRSVSQNPSGSDQFPRWSDDGKLAFVSERDGASDIYIWDGKSTLDGAPDVRTFINVAPDLTGYESSPIWTDSGNLSFVAFGPDPTVQIYEWDGQKAVNISQNPDLHNGGQNWRGDGYWAFTTFFSQEQWLYVRDPSNQTILKTSGQYWPEWSEGGLLMFCVPAPPGIWALAIWDGSDVVKIANGYEIRAFWSNGSGVLCSNG